MFRDPKLRGRALAGVVIANMTCAEGSNAIASISWVSQVRSVEYPPLQCNTGHKRQVILLAASDSVTRHRHHL
eukprot:4805399-Amphidinium_carterae.1